MKEFIEELKHNQNINLEKGLENRVDIDYVIERLENITNPVYDNGALMIGNIDLVIKEIINEITNGVDMSDACTDELLKDLEDLKNEVPNVDIVCINYDTGMGYSFDYWTTNDIVKE